MSNHQPISFNDQMAQAIIDGRKTQTRRVVNSDLGYTCGTILKDRKNQITIKVIGNPKFQRLQHINKHDAILEGVETRDDFIALWKSIYPNDKVKGWDANPLVWVIDFEKVFDDE